MIKQNLPPLTGFRALAAYLVLLAHSLDVSFSYGAIPPIHKYDAAMAYLGMSIFFILSGFVITYNYSEMFKANWGTAFKNFMAARVARLFPLYFIFLLLALGHIPPPAFKDKLGYLLVYLTMTQSWFNLQHITFAPAWSISTEVFFYFVFAIALLFPIRLATRRKILLSILAGWLLTVGALYLSFKFQPSVSGFFSKLTISDPTSPKIWEWLEYYSPYVRVFEFMMGALFAKLYMLNTGRGASQTPPRLFLIISLACIAWIAALFYVNTSTRLASTFPAFLSKNFGYSLPVACLIYISCRYNNFVTRIMSTRAAVFCGEISYSVYIIQFWVYSLFPGFSSSASSLSAYVNSSVRAVLFILFTTVFSYGSYLLIETPSRKFLRRVLSPRSKNV